MKQKIDLSNCDREPIHIPGSIQPHGAIVAIDESTMRIVQTSANSRDVIGLAPDELLGETWEKFLPPETLAHLAGELLPTDLDGTPNYLPPFRTSAGKAVEAIVHRHAGVLILELEQRDAAGPDRSRVLYASLRAALARMEAAGSVGEFCRMAAAQVREFTGFDRVMIYRFSHDQSGAVVAESMRDGLESFLGLNYPASDIPQQARALYVKSWLRFKVDNLADAVPLVPELHPATGLPLDLSYAALRSMSPMHTEYLRNMGVRATMSLSIIKDGELWGLVACHHYDAPRYVSHDARMACEFLAHFLSLQMASKEAAENYDYVARLNQGHAELVEAISRHPSFAEGLYDNEAKLLDWIKADGAAVMIDDEIRLLGTTPPAETVASIFEWLEANTNDEVFAADNMPEICPAAASSRQTSAGVLAVRVSRDLPHFIIWFRAERAKSVNWAGDPRKPVESGEFGDRLTPRKSFELWTEEVSGRSDPWEACETEAAAALRRSILEIVVRQTDALSKLNVELMRSNVELDSFAYIASHDLKEPLRGIHNFSNILIERYGDDIPEDGRDKLRTLMRLTQRMESLIESLLHYSRIGRATLAVSEVDPNKVLRETLELIHARVQEARAEVRVEAGLPRILGDEVLIREVFLNLLTNAVKYNESETPLVEVGCVDPDAGVFFVRDNGIGIPAKHHEQIFRIFRRLHGREAYGGGIGAGLTIAKKIVERHGGEIRLESSPQAGTTFYVSFGKAA